jgi:hypothetical protein
MATTSAARTWCETTSTKSPSIAKHDNGVLAIENARAKFVRIAQQCRHALVESPSRGAAFEPSLGDLPRAREGAVRGASDETWGDL